MIIPQKYLDAPGYSQSDLKLFRKDPAIFYNQVVLAQGRKGIQSRSTDIGDITDCLLTNPSGIEDYEILENVQCSDTLKEIVAQTLVIIQNNSELTPLQKKGVLADPADAKDFLLQVARSIKYRNLGVKGGWGEEAVFKDIIENAGRYYTAQAKGLGKPIINGDDYRVANLTAESIRTSEGTRHIFQKVKGVKNNYQLMLTFKFMDIDLRCLLDVVQGTKTAIYPYDIKTSISHLQFLMNYFKLDYGFQGAVYTLALKTLFPSATVYPFKFIVGVTTIDKQTGKPAEPARVYRMSERDLRVHIEGAELPSGKKIIGLTQTLTDLKWHLQTGKWEHPKIYYDNNFEMPLDSFYGVNLSENETTEEYL